MPAACCLLASRFCILHSSFCIPPSAFRVARVCPYRQQPEQRAQHILPLRHPRHRFHPQRVQPKQRRQNGTPPEGPRHPPENQKHQDRINRVEQHARQVVTRRLQPIELAIQHVRQDRERMPVGRHRVAKGPAHAAPGQTTLHLRVPGDKGAVIETQEFVANRGQECPGHDHKEQHTDGGCSSSVAGIQP